MSEAKVKKSADQEAAGQAIPKSQFKVRSRMDHDGEVYMPGDLVSLTEAQALLARDAIEAA